MNDILTSARRLPQRVIIRVLKRMFTLPAPAARLILNDIIKPKKIHKQWIYRVRRRENKGWFGCWIGDNLHKLDSVSLLKRVHEADVILFYVHGGSFRLGNSTMYMDTNISWLKMLKERHGLSAMIMSVDYRLAPEHKFPGPIEDVVRAYEYLISEIEVKPEKIIIVGDSAGAALLLNMLLITHDPTSFEMTKNHQALSRPAGIVLSSPFVTDKTCSESWKSNQKYDYITEYGMKVIKRDCFEDMQTTEYPILDITALQTEFSSFLSRKMLCFVGQLEVFRDDTLKFVNRLQQDDIDCQVVMEQCVHDWFCVREVVKNKSILRNAMKPLLTIAFKPFKGVLTIKETLWTMIVILLQVFPALVVSTVTTAAYYIDMNHLPLQRMMMTMR
ncbi:unnamed protein product [Rhizopus microsporus]